MRSILLASLLLLIASPSFAWQKSRSPQRPEPTRTETYKTVGNMRLKINLFLPPDHKPGDSRPAVVFYFGGGWRAGSPTQFAAHSAYLASHGIVALTADYRVESRHKSKVVQSIADAKSALRWTRANASRLGIDPQRIAAGGGSAGGHLAAAVATLPDFDEAGEDTNVSCIPNALLLFNPALDLSAKAFNRTPDDPKHAPLLARLGTTPEKVSPNNYVKGKLPPTIIFHGQADTTVPIAQAESFLHAMKQAGNRCELDGYAGEPHGFFNFGRKGNKAFTATLTSAHTFLKSIGYLKGEPNVDEFLKTLR